LGRESACIDQLTDATVKMAAIFRIVASIFGFLVHSDVLTLLLSRHRINELKQHSEPAGARSTV
jgi:hypothetical protein